MRLLLAVNICRKNNNPNEIRLTSSILNYVKFPCFDLQVQTCLEILLLSDIGIFWHYNKPINYYHHNDTILLELFLLSAFAGKTTTLFGSCKDPPFSIVSSFLASITSKLKIVRTFFHCMMQTIDIKHFKSFCLGKNKHHHYEPIF
jgi:hypothetical protein